MPWRADPQPSTRRLYAIGLTANLFLLALYAVAGAHSENAGAKTRLYWVLGAAALLAGGIAFVGRVRGWQERRGLLVGWPVISVIVTMVVGAIDPSATRDFHDHDHDHDHDHIRLRGPGLRALALAGDDATRRCGIRGGRQLRFSRAR